MFYKCGKRATVPSVLFGSSARPVSQRCGADLFSSGVSRLQVAPYTGFRLPAALYALFLPVYSIPPGLSGWPCVLL